MSRFVDKGYFSKALSTSLFMVMLLIACQSEEVKLKPPSDLLGQDEFSAIVADMFLIEGLRSMHTTAEHKELNPTEAYYNGIWEETGIGQERFIRSFEYYKKDRKVIESIYAKAAKIIKTEEDQMKQGSSRPMDEEGNMEIQEE
jgi:hypothetical protein